MDAWACLKYYCIASAYTLQSCFVFLPHANMLCLSSRISSKVRSAFLLRHSTSCATVSPGNSIRLTLFFNGWYWSSKYDTRFFTSCKLLIMGVLGGIAQVNAQTPTTWLHAQQHVLSYKTRTQRIWTHRCLYANHYDSHKANKTHHTRKIHKTSFSQRYRAHIYATNDSFA